MGEFPLILRVLIDGEIDLKVAPVHIPAAAILQLLIVSSTECYVVM